MQLLKFFLKNVKFCFALKKLKKPSSKIAQNNANPLFSLTAWAAQTAQTEEFMLQNVAYRTTVYRTGVLPAWGFPKSWMLENSGQNRLSLMTDVKFSGIHELENPEPVALSYSKQIGKIPVWCVGSGCLIYANTYLDN